MATYKQALADDSARAAFIRANIQLDLGTDPSGDWSDATTKAKFKKFAADYKSPAEPELALEVPVEAPQVSVATSAQSDTDLPASAVITAFVTTQPDAVTSDAATATAANASPDHAEPAAPTPSALSDLTPSPVVLTPPVPTPSAAPSTSVDALVARYGLSEEMKATPAYQAAQRQKARIAAQVRVQTEALAQLSLPFPPHKPTNSNQT